MNYLRWTYYLIPRLLLGLLFSVYAVYGALFVWHRAFFTGSGGFPAVLALLTAVLACFFASRIWSWAGRIQLEGFLKRAKNALEDQDFAAGRKYYRKAMALTGSSHYSPAAEAMAQLQFFHRYADFLCAAGSADAEAVEIYNRYFRQFPDDAEFAGKVIPLMKASTAINSSHLAFLGRLSKLRPEFDDFADFTAKQYLNHQVYDTDAQEILLDAVRRNSPLKTKALNFLLPKMLKQERADSTALEVYLQAFYHQVEHHDLKPMLGRIAEKARYEENPGPISKLIAQAVEELPAEEREAVKASVRQERLQKVALKEEAAKPEEFLKPETVLPERPALELPNIDIPLDKVKEAGRKAAGTQVKLWNIFAAGAGFLAQKRKIMIWLSAAIIAGVIIYGVMKTGFNPPPTETVSLEVISDKPCTIQIAAFKDRERAEALIKTINAKGCKAYLTPPLEGGSWYQVRFGHYDSVAEGSAAAEELKTKKVIADYFVTNFQGGIYIE